MSAVALMNLSHELAESWGMADIRQLLWAYAAAVKRLGLDVASDIPRARNAAESAAAAGSTSALFGQSVAGKRRNSLTFLEKDEQRREHAALGVTAGYLCEAVWNLAAGAYTRPLFGSTEALWLRYGRHVSVV
jgi:hypothetical protein